MQSSEKSHISKLAKNSLITAFGNIFSIFMIPFTSVITTRSLGVELYGVYSIVQYWASFLANLAGMGFQGMNLRFIPTYRGKGEMSKVKGSILWTLKVTGVASAVVAIFIFIFPNYFSSWFIHRPENVSQLVFDENIGGAFRLFSASIFFTAVYVSVLSSLNGLQAIKYKVLANDIIGNVVKLVSLIVLLVLGMNLYAALISSILQDLAILMVSSFFLLKVLPQLKDTLIPPVYEKKEMSKFAATLFTNSLLNKYTFQLDVLLLGYFHALRDVGIYTIALRLQTLIYMPHYSVLSIFGPVSAELYAAGKLSELEKLYKTVTKWAFSVSLPIFATIVLFSAEILNVFGKDFSAGFLVIIILSVGNLVHDLLGMAGNIIMMSGRIRINLINSVVMAVLNIVVFSVLVKNYGILGAAVGNAFSTISVNLLVLFEVRYIFGFHPFQRSLYKPALAILIAGSLIWSIKTAYVLPFYSYTFILYIVVMVLVYMGVVYALKLDAADQYVIQKIRNRFPILKGGAS